VQKRDVQTTDDNERAELAYQVWASEADQNLKKTAAITGIPYRSIAYYAASRGWQQRYLEQMAPESERAALLARNRMRLKLPELEEELWMIIAGKAPLRAFDGTIVTLPNGDPILDYAAQPRDRAYAIKLYLEYSMAGIVPEELKPAHNQLHRTPLQPSMSLHEATAAIIDANVHDVSGERKKRRQK
jgi:hypothetical protein